MANEYNGDKIVLRSTDGTQMSLARFFELALNDGDGHGTEPSQGKSSSFNPNHHAWDMQSGGLIGVVPVRTPTSGTVTMAGDGWNGGMGTCALITDELSKVHRFMHMAEGSLKVGVGDSVNQGDTLGFIGSTGDSTGAHLHYDVQVNGSKIDDPIDAYDSSTLPQDWNMNDAAAAGNWNYIQLDDAATDFGPPGGEVPSEPFFPQTPCHDIGHPQVSGGSLNPCIDAIANNGGGGVIIQVGGIRNSGFDAETDFNPAEAVQRTLDVGLGLGIYFYNYANYENDMTQAFEDALAYLQTIGATKDKVNMGVWIDTEQGQSWDPIPSSDANTNYAYVERFMTVFNNAGYPLVGVYSSAGTFYIYPAESIGDKPIWAAYWTGTFDTVDRSTLDPYLPEETYTRVYIMQYTDHGTIPGWSDYLDCNKVLTPLPTAGSGGGGGGGGGGSYTLEVLVDVIPPKRIYFTPNPGILTIDADLQNREQTIEIKTDAEDAIIYYTLDGSAPYEYNTDDMANITYSISASAVLYTEPIKIYSDTHIRAVAISSSGSVSTFNDILAKGSGTFLYSYRVLAPDWAVEREAYSLDDERTHEALYEENKQAFIIEHTTETIEDIVYAAVHLSTTTGGESEASEEAPSIAPADSSDLPASEPEPEPEPSPDNP